MQVTINSFLTRSGVPATDIDDLNPHPDGESYPKIRIWKTNGNDIELVVGSPSGSGNPNDGIMVPVDDTGTQDGFYQYVFSDLEGYDPTSQYIIRVDGGPSLQDSERYQSGAIEVNVWDDYAVDHLGTGTMGLALSQIKANTEQLALDINDVAALVETILKYETNRTKIDPNTSELIVYDDDCVTELRRFKLLDVAGNPSTDSVCERVPISATDGKPVC